jgi:hypothetical protein
MIPLAGRHEQGYNSISKIQEGGDSVSPTNHKRYASINPRQADKVQKTRKSLMGDYDFAEERSPSKAEVLKVRPPHRIPKMSQGGSVAPSARASIAHSPLPAPLSPTAV